ncbi:amidohydrolase [Halobacillus salinarum]|uniref:Amidohydrolase n=1 Tax=Halobacillus salinarum TaxID=2932257 RepID=A0ABY4EMM8_9BACI|nr:amidohydrolase [Halobacillus salinarum]UOQ45108.1 amidohydrolase [Halobacillus salinarum]
MTIKVTDLASQVEDLYPKLVELRRHFHSFPELSFSERMTSEKILLELKALDAFEIESGVGGHGIIATLNMGEGPIIGLRADMDALPIQEQSKESFTSRHPGVMHACGHDAHMAILLGTAKLLAEAAHSEFLQGTVKLIFQPAEEDCDEKGDTGAVKMLNSGKLERLDRVLALHMCPWRETGSIQIHDGPSMANNDNFELAINGSGGHAGYPQHVTDPVWISTFILQALYSLNSRKVNPLDVGTLSVGEIHAGHSNNVIPHTVNIKGTMRSYTSEVRELLVQELKQTAQIVTTMGGSFELDIQKGEPALVNHPEINQVIRKAAEGLRIVEEPFGMGSEDFSHMTAKYPGALFFLGCGLDPERSLHHPEFDIDERAMVHGVTIFMKSIQHLLWKGE